MTTEQKIKMALSYAGISQAELARRINITPQNFNQKLKNNRMTTEDMVLIAQAIGCIWHAEFQFPDGTTI